MRLIVTGGSGFIGTHVARKAMASGVEWLNLDIRRPVSGEAVDRWERVDVMDRDRLTKTFTTFRPTHVLHLAARTDTDARSLSDYGVNTVGTIGLAVCSLVVKPKGFASSFARSSERTVDRLM